LLKLLNETEGAQIAENLPVILSRLSPESFYSPSPHPHQAKLQPALIALQRLRSRAGRREAYRRARRDAEQ